MNYAPTYLANAVAFIVMVLQLFGIDIAPGDLQTTIVTLLAIVVPAFTMFRQMKTGRATFSGKRPK